MNEQALIQNMADFYLEMIFQGIPAVTVEVTDNLSEGTLGEFYLEEAPDYDYSTDELKNAYEYRSRYKTFCDGFCGIDMNQDASFMDPLNHPIPHIKISQKLTKDIRETTATLLHELLHYYLWYRGYDFHDNDMYFYQKCKSMGLPTNYDIRWTGKGWEDSYDYSKTDKYIKLFIAYLAEMELEEAS